MNNSVAFVCERHLSLGQRHSITLKGNLISIRQSLPISPPQALASINLPSVPKDLPILDITKKWTHTICDLLCPVSFTFMFSQFIYVLPYIQYLMVFVAK